MYLCAVNRQRQSYKIYYSGHDLRAGKIAGPSEWRIEHINVALTGYSHRVHEMYLQNSAQFTNVFNAIFAEIKLG